MPLPEKGYYSLQEIAERWGIPLKDVCDHAVEEAFIVHAWIGKVHVEIGYYEEVAKDDAFWIPAERKWFNGYAIVRPLDLREVFRQGQCSVHLYQWNGAAGEELLKIITEKDYIIEPRDLMVSRAERDRMEVLHDLCLDKRDPPKPAISRQAISFAGRPSVMHQLLNHMEQRAKNGAVCCNLTKESEYLYAWAQENIRDMQIPTPKAIANGVRKHYRALTSQRETAA